MHQLPRGDCLMPFLAPCLVFTACCVQEGRDCRCAPRSRSGGVCVPQSKEPGQLRDPPAPAPASVSRLSAPCPLHRLPLLVPEGFSNPALGDLFNCTALTHFAPICCVVREMPWAHPGPPPPRESFAACAHLPVLDFSRLTWLSCSSGCIWAPGGEGVGDVSGCLL